MDWLRLAPFGLALTCAVAAFLSLFGAFDDRLDILTHFAPAYVAGGLIALAAGVLVGGGPVSWLAAITAVGIGGALMAGEITTAFRPAEAPNPAAKTLTLVQFNLWAHNADPTQTAGWVAARHADVLTLEETAGEGAKVVQALAPLYPFRTAGRPGDDTLILSRERPSTSGPIAAGGSPSGVWARFGDGEGAYTVAAVHLTWPIPAGPQRAQMERLAATVERLGGDHLILAGDFNSTPWSFALRRQDARLARSGVRRLTRALFSWPSVRFQRFRLAVPFPLLPIDHVYAGAGWRSVRVTRGPVLGSDHYPVEVVLAR